MDRAGKGALLGRILFWGRFSHGVAMGWKRNAPCGASDLAKIRAAFLNKAEQFIHGFTSLIIQKTQIRGIRLE
jgi:hypothetical protein